MVCLLVLLDSPSLGKKGVREEKTLQVEVWGGGKNAGRDLREVSLVTLVAVEFCFSGGKCCWFCFLPGRWGRDRVRGKIFLNLGQ